MARPILQRSHFHRSECYIPINTKGRNYPGPPFCLFTGNSHGYSQILPETVLLLRLFCHKLRHHWN